MYRLAQVGEVLAPGGKALTLVNLEDIYMEIFLPSEQAARLKIGDEARITLDHAPGRAAVGHISFVSPEAQFTPKQVETRSERDKLMFRVKIQVPEELVSGYIEPHQDGRPRRWVCEGRSVRVVAGLAAKPGDAARPKPTLDPPRSLPTPSL